MKTLYEVSELDYGLNRQWGTFEDKAVADAMCERVNAYNNATDDNKAEVRSFTVFEPGDPVFTCIALYNIRKGEYTTRDICPTMYEHWMGEEWMREVIASRAGRVGAFGRAGTSAEDAVERLKPQIEKLEAEGLIATHREYLLAIDAKETDNE